MARVTVEDCLEKFDNHFKLVLVANHRARQLLGGREPQVEREDDKATVLALREIASGKVHEEILTESIEQKDAAEEELKGLLADAMAEPEIEGLNIPGDEKSKQADPLDEALAEALMATTNEDVVSEETAQTIPSEDEADNISLEALQTEEEKNESVSATDNLQIDELEAPLAETAEEMEKRADLNLDHVETNEDDNSANETDNDKETS